MKKVIFVLLFLLAILMVVACGKKADPRPSSFSTQTSIGSKTFEEENKALPSPAVAPHIGK